MNRVSKLIYGAPPPPGAPQADRLRYIRQLFVRQTAWTVPLLVVGFVLVHEYWGIAVAGVVILGECFVVMRLSRGIRRADHGSDSSGPFGR